MRFRLPRSLPGRQTGGERSEDRDDSESPRGIGLPARPTPTGATPPQTIVPRWVQLVVLPLALLGLWALARAAGPVLLILIAASTGALILNPVIKRLQRARIHRGIAIFLVYIAMFATLIGIGVLLANPIS